MSAHRVATWISSHQLWWHEIKEPRLLTGKVGPGHAVVDAISSLSVAGVLLVVLLLDVGSYLANHGLVLDSSNADLKFRNFQRRKAFLSALRAEPVLWSEGFTPSSFVSVPRGLAGQCALACFGFRAEEKQRSFLSFILTSTALACLSAGIWLSIIFTT